jgi:protein gp37
MHPQWVRALRDQCVSANVPFFFKSWGEWAPYSGELSAAARHCHQYPDGQGMACVGKRAAGHLLDGQEWRQIPQMR